MSGSSMDERIARALDEQEGVETPAVGEGNEAAQQTQQHGVDDQRQDRGASGAGAGQPQQSAVGTSADDQSGAQHRQQGKAPAGKQQARPPAAADDGGVVEQQQREHLSRTQRAVQRETVQLRTQLETTQRDLQTFREAAILPQQLGLQPQDVTTAMHFMSHWRRDPVGAAKQMLTELRAGGYNLEDLPGGVDVAAIQRMIRSEIAPFQQDRASQLEAAQQQRNTQQEVNNLYADMPWTQAQTQEIVALMDADASLDLRSAAYQLQIWAMQQGYDINQPLRPQHVQRLQTPRNGNGATSPQHTPQQRVNNARVPGPTVNGEAVVQRNGSTSVGHNRSTRDIVRESMREVGLDV